MGPSRPRGSSGTMKRFPAKVKGSRLDPAERRHGHRGALDSYSPLPPRCLNRNGDPHLVSTALKAPLPSPAPPARGCPTSTGKERLKSPGSPHRSLTISFLELFIRTWSCSLVTMMPSVSSASFTMNLQGERVLLATQKPSLPGSLGENELAVSR